MKHVLLTLFTLCLFPFYGQNKAIVDSLFERSRTANDSVKIRCLISISDQIQFNNPNRALEITDSALIIAKKANIKSLIGVCYSEKGGCYTTLGKNKEALENLFTALKIFDKLKLRRFKANSLNTIGNVYLAIPDNDKAYEYYLKAHELVSEEPVIEDLQAITSFGIGNMLFEQKKLLESIEYFKTAERFFKKVNHRQYEAMCVAMLGNVFFQDSNYVAAEKYLKKALYMSKEIGETYNQAAFLHSLSNIELKKNNIPNAIKYEQESFDLHLNRKAILNIRDAAKELSYLYELNNQPQKALQYLKIHNQYNDSISSEERTKALAEAESKYENEKKESELKLKNAELEKSNLKISQRNKLIYVFIGATLIFIILLVLVYRQYIQKKKYSNTLAIKNKEIELQKSLIEYKNKDIQDSINYGRYIQDAILPPDELVKNIFRKNILYYKPKDIISGDFYFLEQVKDKIVLAVADCTGHGVPGAMLSMFAQSKLKNIVSKFDDEIEPNSILNQLCLEFKENLRSNQKNISINDGLDMSIIVIDKKDSKLLFSGAKNNLLILRDGKILELKGDRYGISGRNSEEQLNFKQENINIKTGDQFYMFTDGFVDQFGGIEGKKYKLKKFKNFLLNSNLLDEQNAKYLIDSEFTNWKKNNEQTDDVTVFGFSI